MLIMGKTSSLNSLIERWMFLWARRVLTAFSSKKKKFISKGLLWTHLSPRCPDLLPTGPKRATLIWSERRGVILPVACPRMCRGRFTGSLQISVVWIRKGRPLGVKHSMHSAQLGEESRFMPGFLPGKWRQGGGKGGYVWVPGVGLIRGAQRKC